jgi:Bucentaur or craniofacial development
VSRTVLEGSADDIAATAKQAAAGKPQKGLDDVLASLTDAKSISTVTKSSLDWDKYKEVEGIEEDLATVTKDGAGYLHRQDFLNRVDVRQYEADRDQRASKRKK